VGNYVWEPCPHAKFHYDSFIAFGPRIGEIVFTRLIIFVYGFFRQARVETVAPILTLNTSNSVVPRKDVHLGGFVEDVPQIGVKFPKPPQNGHK